MLFLKRPNYLPYPRRTTKRQTAYLCECVTSQASRNFLPPGMWQLHPRSCLQIYPSPDVTCNPLNHNDYKNDVSYRARKLAQREEQEMEACTFQPNAWRRRPNAPSGYANTVGNPSLDREGDRSGVGEDAGGGSSAEEPQGEHATGRAGTGAGGPRRIGAACQRLFEESKRLKERRFEAEERKRMWEEESYARTCTFKVGDYVCESIPRLQEISMSWIRSSINLTQGGILMATIMVSFV